MKLLAIVADIDFRNLGGAENHFMEVLRRISSKLRKAVVLVGPKKSSYPRLSNVTFVAVNYPHVRNLYGLFYILFATPIAVIQAIKTKPDIIWAKQEFPQAQVGAMVKLVTGIPLYITSQNPRLGEEELVGLGGKVVTSLVSKAFATADTVAAVSSYSASLAKKMGAKKVIIIPNGTTITFPGASTHRDQVHHRKSLRIITTSSLIPRNGISTLIAACALLPKNIHWELRIAGNGPQDKTLRRQAKGLPIKFLGRVPNNSIIRLLLGSNLFIRPSRFEGFGSSFIEAMAAGLPVVGTPVGGIIDFLTDKKTGFLVPPDDPVALAQTIEFIHQHPKISSKIATAGQMLVRARYNWDKIGRDVWHEFKNLSNDP